MPLHRCSKIWGLSQKWFSVYLKEHRQTHEQRQRQTETQTDRYTQIHTERYLKEPGDGLSGVRLHAGDVLIQPEHWTISRIDHTQTHQNPIELIEQRARPAYSHTHTHTGKYMYYYYYYRKKRFRWCNVKRLQGHLTNAKDSDKTRVWRKVRTEYLWDAIVGRAVEIRKTSTKQFRLQLTSKQRQWR